MTPAEVVARQPAAARPIDEIIIHCTATPAGRPVSVAEIRAWHRTRGWADIGYHYVVLLDGSVAPGRPEAKIGAHVAGHNEGTLGVVYVGGVGPDGRAADTRTPAQREALTATVRALIVKYPGVGRVSGHNEYAAKACPSFDVRTDPLAGLVRELRGGGRRLAPPPPLPREPVGEPAVTNPFNPASGFARAIRALFAAFHR